MAYHRRILIEPNPILRKVAKKMTALELRMPLTQQLIDDMLETMYAAPGIGLAAPQVGNLQADLRRRCRRGRRAQAVRFCESGVDRISKVRKPHPKGVSRSPERSVT